MPIKWNKNGDRWTSGKRKIQKSARAYTVEEVDGKFYRPYDPDAAEIYHEYEDGKYIGQSKTLDEAKEKHQKRQDKEDRGRP